MKVFVTDGAVYDTDTARKIANAPEDKINHRSHTHTLKKRLNQLKLSWFILKILICNLMLQTNIWI